MIIIKRCLIWYKKQHFSKKITLLISSSLLFVVLVFLSVIFSPVVKNEISYLFMPKKKEIVVAVDKQVNQAGRTYFKNGNNFRKIIKPADNNFSIIIPKIGVNSKIIENVNPSDKSEYLKKLKFGVAHSKTSGLPGDKKNTFIFAHSSNSFYDFKDYNSIFYLLYKLDKGDIFYLVYKGVVYRYEVEELRKVDKYKVEYLYSEKDDSSVILMTCWPPGTNKKRLLVFGKLVGVN